MKFCRWSGNIIFSFFQCVFYCPYCH